MFAIAEKIPDELKDVHKKFILRVLGICESAEASSDISTGT